MIADPFAGSAIRAPQQPVPAGQEPAANILVLGNDSRTRASYPSQREEGAQCTDARVNQVTKVLYQHYPRLEDIAAASQEEIEREIYTTGFYHNKARNLRACAQALLLRFDGTVPDEMEALLTLPGVGRKTANLILGEIYGKPSIVVDTHVKRVSRRLGLVTATDPTKVEAELKTVLPESFWILWNTRLMALGRTYCTAKAPTCAACYLSDLCPRVGVE